MSISKREFWMDSVGAIGNLRRRHLSAKSTLENGNEFQTAESEIQTRATPNSACEIHKNNTLGNVNNNGFPNLFSRSSIITDDTQNVEPSQSKGCQDNKPSNSDQNTRLDSITDSPRCLSSKKQSPLLSSKKQSPLLPDNIPIITVQSPSTAHVNDSSTKVSVTFDANDVDEGRFSPFPNSAINDQSIKETVVLDYAGPPDGGWGWVVVAACFILLFFVVGTGSSQGVFIPHFEEAFEVNASEASFIASLMTSMYFLSGPVVSGLINVYGCRVVACCGAVLTSVAFAIASFSESIFTMIVLYSLIGGFGFGMMYLPGMVMTGYYFDRHRARATGVALCGSGVGSMVIAPVSQELIKLLGWEMCLRILAGMILTASIAALVFRPLYRPQVVEQWTYGNDSEDDEEEEAHEHLRKISLSDHIFNDMKHDTAVDDDLLFYKRHSHDGKEEEEKAARPTSLVRSKTSLVKSPRITNTSLGTRGTTGRRTKREQTSTVVSRATTRGSRWGDVDVMFPLAKTDIFYPGNLDRLYAPQSGTPSRTQQQHVTEAQDGWSLEAKAKSSVNPSTTLEQNRQKRHWSSAFAGLFDFSLLRSPVFLVYCTTCCLAQFGAFSVLFFVQQAYVENTHDSCIDATLLISCYGVAQVVGRLVTGFIADNPRVNCILFKCVALFIGGVPTFLLPLIPGEYPQLYLVYMGLLGTSMAVIISLRSKIIIQLLGIENLTRGFGILNFLLGVNVLVGPPVAGALYDVTKDYDYIFYMAGSFFCVGGLMCVVVIVMAARKKKLVK